MMCAADWKLKALADLYERLQGLRNDGYWQILHYTDSTLVYYKLRHSNGKCIELTLDWLHGRFTQHTDGKIKYEKEVCQP